MMAQLNLSRILNSKSLCHTQLCQPLASAVLASLVQHPPWFSNVFRSSLKENSRATSTKVKPQAHQALLVPCIHKAHAHSLSVEESI